MSDLPDSWEKGFLPHIEVPEAVDLGAPQLNELENIFQLEGLRNSDPHLLASAGQTNLSHPANPSPSHPLPDLSLPPQTLHPPLNAAPAAQEPLTTQVEVNLYHKPRGKGGVWQRVESNDRIRVTKGKGKALKIEVKTEFEWTEPAVSIVDLGAEPPLVSTDGVSVQTIKSATEFEINISRLCKRLQLLIRLRLTNGYDLLCKTVEFATHDNGKEAVKKDIAASSSSDVPESPSDLFDEEHKRRRDADGSAGQSVHVVSGELDVRGVVRAQAFVQYSDARLKTNVEDIVNAYQLVSQLQGKTYQWKEGTVFSDQRSADPQENSSRVIGLIAQEVQRVLPEVVVRDPRTGLLAVNYTDIVPILIEALKEHVQEYRSDKGDLQADIQQIKNQLEKINLERQQQEQRAQQHAGSAPPSPLANPPTPPAAASSSGGGNPFGGLASLRSSGGAVSSLAGTRGPVWQWFARKLGSHIRARAEQLARHFGTPLCLLVFWKKDVLPDVDILIAKANVSVDSKGGDADGPLHAHRFKAMFVRGDMNGFYRVALDFKNVRDSRQLLDAAPFLLTFDFRREGNAENDPPALDLFWMSLQNPRPEGSKWYVGVLEYVQQAARWVEAYNILADHVYPSLVPPSVLLAVQTKQHQQHQQRQQQKHDSPAQRHSPQPSPRTKGSSPRVRKEASPSLPNLAGLQLHSPGSPGPSGLPQRTSPPAPSLSMPPGIGAGMSPKRERDSSGGDSPPSKISPSNSPARARELATQQKAHQQQQQHYHQQQQQQQPPPQATVGSPALQPLGGVGWQRGSFGLFAAPPPASAGPQPVGYVLQPSPVPGQPPSLVPVYSNPPAALAAPPPHVFVNPLSLDSPGAFSTVYPPPPYSYPTPGTSASNPPPPAGGIKTEK